MELHVNHRPDSFPRRTALSPSHLLGEVRALITPSPFPGLDQLRLDDIPRGEGQAVLVLPGSLRSDSQTAEFRAFLAGFGYAAYGWDLGVNWGPTNRLIKGATERLIALSRRHERVALVGYSMGGLFARLLAARRPALVSQVITVCSPIHQPARSVWAPVEPFQSLWPGPDLRAIATELAADPVVPSTCLYSPDDGVVAWGNCRDRSGIGASIEIRGPHVTMVDNAQAIRAILQQLGRSRAAT